ncbi:hypothetical protein BJY04DRAFT_195418 [Aspergillus karnatakaensis]|uniref:uncharacterized protein n=1 Tax=Aspergillus karnatakaensis TaxID=1810916 RepID=UPI003CCCCD3C
MCPMLLSSLRDGPTMILSSPPDHAFYQHPHQPKLASSPGVTSRPAFSNGFHSNGFLSGVNSGTSTFPGLTASHKPSRKRSRDDVAAEDNATEQVPKVSVPPIAPVSQEKPIYGESMTLINPRTGMALSAESQTGTWYEEAIDNAMATAKSTTSQTDASRKSQRLDPSAPSLDDITSSRLERQLLENDIDENRRILNTSSRSNPLTHAEPLVDDATRLLGISWQRVQAGDDVDMAAAVRGWKKYVDRQFSQYLGDSEILMKNRALNAYLVAARPIIPFAGPAQVPAFYLFNDDLTQGQLVATSWDSCLRNLRSSPVVFEGTEILNAFDKPLRSVTQHGQNVLGTNPVDSGLPLLQTMCAQPTAGFGLSTSVGLGTGMDIDL